MDRFQDMSPQIKYITISLHFDTGSYWKINQTVKSTIISHKNTTYPTSRISINKQFSIKPNEVKVEIANISEMTLNQKKMPKIIDSTVQKFALKTEQERLSSHCKPCSITCHPTEYVLGWYGGNWKKSSN